MNLPNTFEEKMKHLLGEEYEDYLKCYEEPRHYGLRAVSYTHLTLPTICSV